MSQGGMAGLVWPGVVPTASALSVLISLPATPAVTSTGCVFFSSVVSTFSTNSHIGTPCLSTAISKNHLNPNVALPIDAPPSYVDYGTLPTAAPKATGLAFDRERSLEPSDLTVLSINNLMGLSSTLTKRDIPSFSTNAGPIIGAVVIALGIILVLFLSIKYCIRSRSKTADLERGSDSRRHYPYYPYYEEVTRGRRRYRDGSPPATRPDDIPISEGYGMDPVDLARAQNWQDDLGEKFNLYSRKR